MPKREVTPLPPKEFPFTPQELQDFAENYEIVSPIHESNVSRVYSAKHLSAHGFFAVKFSVLTARLQNEMRAGELTEESPYVIDYVDGRINDDESLGFVVTPYTFWDMGKTYRLPKEAKNRIGMLENMSRGLMDIHGEGLVHRDLKPKNIFLEGTVGDRPIIGDLGSVCENGYLDNLYEEETANILPNPDCTSANRLVLTPYWAAPEQYDHSKRLTTKVDMFGLGLVVCNLLLGMNPVQRAVQFEYPRLQQHKDDETELEEYHEALTKLAGDTENYFKYIPKELISSQSLALRKLLDNCLSGDPAERPDAEEAVFTLNKILKA